MNYELPMSVRADENVAPTNNLPLAAVKFCKY